MRGVIASKCPRMGYPYAMDGSKRERAREREREREAVLPLLALYHDLFERSLEKKSARHPILYIYIYIYIYTHMY